jgi:spore coat protein JC
MVATIVHQLTRNMTEEEVKRAGLETYFVDHTAGVYTQFASGTSGGKKAENFAKITLGS